MTKHWPVKHRRFARAPLARLRGPGRERGFTLLELLAALALAAIMIGGVVAMVNSSAEDTRGQQAALYQAQLTTAASQLIQQNSAALLTQASASTPVVVPFKSTTSPYQLVTYLSATMQGQNAYGQAPCLLVYTGANGALQGLLVTEGGQTISDTELGYIAANSGQGGGSIPATNNAAGAALGAFGAWSMAKPNPAGVSCSGTRTGTGHLASEVFFNSSLAQNSDFLYRVAVPGFPAANTMQVPIVLATETDYAGCTASGSISADTLGNVLSCQDGVWEPQASFHWRSPVADAAALAALPSPRQGDVAMTLATNRAYTFDGTTWNAVAVDEQGNLSVPGTLNLGNGQILGAVCTEPASATAVSTDASSRVLSCVNGTWQSQSEILPAAAVADSNCAIEVSNPGATDFPNCTGSPSAATFDPNNGYDVSVVTRTVPPMPKNGNISIYAWAHMTDAFVATCPGPPQDLSQGGGAYETLFAELVDNDTQDTIASAVNQSSRIEADVANVNLSLTYALPVNKTGYFVRFTTFWVIFAPSVNPANFHPSFCNGSTFTPQTGVVTSWTITPFY
jgi:prepilin-type N-terminal cleavage/methylation domain-containing protein